MASYLPNGLASSGSNPTKLSDRNETSKGVIVPLYSSKEEMEGALDDTGHLRDWNFRGSKCDRCGLPNSKVDGLLIQCGICKNAHYCSRKCFNDDLEYHQSQCQSASLAQQPTAGPDVRRRGDEEYQETDEQRTNIQKREEELSSKRAAAEEATLKLRDPLPPPVKEQKVKRSWDWDTLFGSSNGSTTNHSSTEANDTDDDDSVHSFAPEAEAEVNIELSPEKEAEPAEVDVGPEDLILEPAVGVDEDTVELETEASHQLCETVEEDIEQIDDEDDDEESRLKLKQQITEEYDEEEIERHRRRVAKILELDAEHRRRLKIGDGDIPQYRWEPEHVNLTEAELIKRIYGWEVPDWVRNRMLRQTNVNELEKTKKKNFSQTPAWANQSTLRHRSSVGNCGLAPDATRKPEWATGRPLRSTSHDAAGPLACPNGTELNNKNEAIVQQRLNCQFSKSLDFGKQIAVEDRTPRIQNVHKTRPANFRANPEYKTPHETDVISCIGSLSSEQETIKQRCLEKESASSAPTQETATISSSRLNFGLAKEGVRRPFCLSEKDIVSAESAVSDNRDMSKSFSKPPVWAIRSPLRKAIVTVCLDVAGPSTPLSEGDISATCQEDIKNGIETLDDDEKYSEQTSAIPLDTDMSNTIASPLAVLPAAFSPPSISADAAVLAGGTHESIAGSAVDEPPSSLSYAFLIPTASKSFSHAPSWATRSTLRGQSVVNRSPAIVQSKPPEWATRSMLRSKSDEEIGVAALSPLSFKKEEDRK